MHAIAAVDDNWAIGYKNRLLLCIPPDLKRFRELTLGKTVIFGSKTLESFPGGKPLKQRRNILLTGKEKSMEGAIIAHSLEEALKEADGENGDEVFVIGGQSVYEQMLPYCETVSITRIADTFQADAYFPNLDENPDFIKTWESEEQMYKEWKYRWITYVRKAGGLKKLENFIRE